MKRKLLALLMAMLLMLSAFSGVVFAEGEEAAADAPAMEETKSDYYGEYDEAIKALKRFGILGEDFDPLAKVTRGDFIGRAMYITGAGEIPASEEIFSDVPVSNENAGAINAAYKMGIVAGTGNGKFSPSSTLTAEQAAKILVTILGYDVRANAYGGYPGGYLVVATTQGILKNVSVGDYDECTWGVAAQLIYNAMNADVLQKAVYPEGEYYTVDGENPMTLWMGIYLYKGIVTATEKTGQYTATGCKEGMAIIDDMLFIENGALPEDAVGCPVRAYYKIDETGQNVLLNATYPYGVSSVTVNYDEISPNTSVRSLVVYGEGFSADVNYPIASGSVVSLYNGKYAPLTTAMLKPSYGSVTITDTNGDGIYDKVSTNCSRVLIVKTVSPKTGIIKDKNEIANLDFDVDNSKFNIAITKEGKEITLADIKENDVLVVEESVDGLSVNITVCTDRLRGAISEISDNELTLDGTTFEIVPGLESVFANISAGNTATFYFTHDHKLAGFADVSKGNTDYGYLIIGGIMKGGVAGNNVQLQIFNSQGVKTYSVSDKLRLNGNMTSPLGEKYQGEVLLNALAQSSYCFQLYENAGLATQPSPDPGATMKSFYCNQTIRFNTDDEGLVTEIETAVDNRVTTGGTGAYYEDGLSLDYTSYAGTLDPTGTISYGSVMYSGNESNIISSRYVIPDSNCWKIPNFDTWKSFYDGGIDLDTMTKFCSTFSPRSAWVANTGYGNIEVYDANRDKVAGLIIQGVAGAADPIADLDFFLVDKMVNTLDEEGYETRKLYGCYSGKYVGYEIDFNATQIKERPELVTTLKQGDIIRIARDSVGKIAFIRRVFTMDDFDAVAHQKQVDIYKSHTGETKKVDGVNKYKPTQDTIEFFRDNYGIEIGEYDSTNAEVKKLMTNYSEWILYGNVYNDWSLNGESKTGWGGGYSAYYHRTGVPPILWYVYQTSFSWDTICNAIHGKVVGKNGDILTIDLGTAEDGTKLPEKLIAAHYKYAKYYVYDEENEKVYVGSLADIDPDDPCQTIVLRNRYQAFWEAIIIKHAQPVGELPWVGGYTN